MELLLRTDSAQETSQDCFGPDVLISEEDETRYAQLLRPNIPPPIDPYSNVAWEDYDQVEERLARVRIACYKVPACCINRSPLILVNVVCYKVCTFAIAANPVLVWYACVHDFIFCIICV